jgi:hypothetical protein
MDLSPPRLAPADELIAQALARRRTLPGQALPPDIAAARGGLVEDVIGRLDEARRFQLAQKILGADQTDALIDDGAPPLDVAVLEQQEASAAT